MNAPMPSPIGHALAGIAVVLAADPQAAAGGLRRFLSRPVTLGCVALATLPDADLLVRGFHRTATHSVGATIVVIIVAMVVTGWVTRNGRSPSRQDESPPRRHKNTPRKHDNTKGDAAGRESGHTTTKRLLGWGLVWVLAAAQASHLLTDWLGTDSSTPAGIQVFWPFSDRWFISGWDLFPRLERRDMLSPTSMALNLMALVWEVVLMGPIVSVLWWLRDRNRSTERAQRPQKTT